MAFGRSRPVRRNRRGQVELNLPDPARQVLAQLCRELRLVLTTDDPSLVRLFPNAYTDDPDREAEYQILARSELTDRRLEVLDVIERTIDARILDEDEVKAWMHGINQLRLVLGTQLGVSDDELAEPLGAAAADPEAWADGWAAYEYLSALLDAFVSADGL